MRELRYLVIKLDDIETLLSEEECMQLSRLADQINKGREERGKDVLNGVFIKDSMGIYPAVSRLLDDELSGRTPDNIVDEYRLYRQLVNSGNSFDPELADYWTSDHDELVTFLRSEEYIPK